MSESLDPPPQAGPPIPVLDPEPLARLHQLGGQAFVQKMVALFLEQTPARLTAAAQELEQGNLEALGRRMHSLKSSAGQLGARQVQEVASLLEQACEAGQEAPARALFPALERAWQEACHLLIAQYNPT